MKYYIQGEKVNLNEPKVAGILNLTEDSFFDGGCYNTEKKALLQVEKLISEGADFLDIGGQSTRPGSKFITAEEELKRVIPIIKIIKKEYPRIKLSIDTFWSKVANESVQEGVGMINDVSGGTIDPLMLPTIGRLKVSYVLMHMRGTPQTMNQYTKYENLVENVVQYFEEKIKEAKNFGIENLFLDPGFGFSKTLEQNYELLNQLNQLKKFNLPIYIGISRKKMIYETLNISVDEALVGTSALHLYALLQGANVLRVHDVKEAKQMITLAKQIKSN